jgi:hypothetical protein
MNDILSYLLDNPRTLDIAIWCNQDFNHMLFLPRRFKLTVSWKSHFSKAAQKCSDARRLLRQAQDKLHPEEGWGVPLRRVRSNSWHAREKVSGLDNTADERFSAAF